MPSDRNDARRHRVHEDPSGASDSERFLRDARQRRLRRGVGDERRRLPLGRVRRDVDDAGPLGAPQQRQRGAHAAHRAQRADVERRDPLGVVELLEAPTVDRPGRVDEDVELAPPLPHLGERGATSSGAVRSVGIPTASGAPEAVSSARLVELRPARASTATLAPSATKHSATPSSPSTALHDHGRVLQPEIHPVASRCRCGMVPPRRRPGPR